MGTPHLGSTEYPFSGKTNVPNWRSEGSWFGLSQSQRLPNDPVDKVVIGPHDTSTNSVFANRVPNSNAYIPHPQHEVIAVSDSYSGKRPLHRVGNTGLYTPCSVRRLVQLPNGQTAVLQVGPTGYGQVLLPTGRAAPLQVGCANYQNGHSGDQARAFTSQVFSPQRASNGGGQALSSSISEGQENNQLNSTKFQLPAQAVLEHNSRSHEGSLFISSEPGRSRNMTEAEIHKVREFLVQFQHASNCPFQIGECMDPCCKKIKLILEHIQHCGNKNCRCRRVKDWSNHFRRCRGYCSVCTPVYAASLKSDGCNIENERITSKRTLSALYNNNSEVLSPPSKRCKIDDPAQVGQLTSKSLNNRTEPIVVDRERCMDPSKETTEKLRESSTVVSIEKGIDMQPTVQEKSSVKHGHQQVKLRSNITVPLAARIVHGTSFSFSITPVHVMEMNSRHNWCIDQREENAIIDVDLATQRIPFPNTDTVEDLKPSHTHREDNLNRECQVTSTPLKTAPELIILDEENSRDLPEEMSENDKESVGAGVAGAEPFVEEKITVQYGQKAEKKLSPITTLSSDTHVSIGSSFLYPASSDQVIKNMNRLHHCVDQSGATADINQIMEDSLAEQLEEKQGQTETIKFEMESGATADINQIMEDSLTEQLEENQGQTETIKFEMETKGKEDVNQGLEGLMDENVGKLYWMDKLPFESARGEKFIEEKNSFQCEQHLESQIHTEDGMFEVAVDSDISMPLTVHLNQTMLKANGASLLSSFTSDQVREHIEDLKQCSKQAKETTNSEQRMDGYVDNNCCSLCGLGELSFKILPIPCSKCPKIIKKNIVCYRKRNAESTDDGGDVFMYYCRDCMKKEGLDMVEKVINSGTNEPWVKCDKCRGWQHQICALFNNKNNECGQAKYICPICYLSETQILNPKSLAYNEILDAKHLPRTKLSDYIEQRLSRRLEEDRQQRADKLGKNINEAIQLFQKIGGADVCLFTVYSQEYGFECPFPNRGHVYLAYIDSVNYFRPSQIKAASGESLRTYVYHEILIGYLDYFKKRGFSSCQLWVSPASKGNEYIFYSHPKEQKMPNLVVLRDWYQKLILKAEEEKIVVGRTNLYDKYLMSHGGKGKRNSDAIHLPYFDGDFWPTMKEKCKELAKFKASIRQKKDYLIIMELQQNCEHYKKFPLDRMCQETVDSFNADGINPTNKDKVGVEADLRNALDENENILSSIFDDRGHFLDFCKENSYQFDTLRRAKHSTMMILHHLHKEAKEGA